jgi:hypothetical protein
MLKIERDKIKERDGNRCIVCGSPQYRLHVHHAVPVSAGGSNSPHNLVTLCRPCEFEVTGLPMYREMLEDQEIQDSCLRYLAAVYGESWDPYQPGYPLPSWGRRAGGACP